MGYGISNVWPDWVNSIAKRVKIAEAGVAYAKSEYFLNKMEATLRMTHGGIEMTDFKRLSKFNRDHRDRARERFFEVMREAGE